MGFSMISSLRLPYSPDCTEDLMNKANTHLAARQPSQAHEIYTKILQARAPGHPCALLNRSLAYIAMGYPELAVADAYRAAMVCHDMRQSRLGGSSDDNMKKVARYTTAELLAKKSGEPWTTEPTCYTGPGWLGVPLAAIYLHASQLRTENSERLSVCTALEVKAVYRLVYALWRCGGGAVSDALGLLCDAKAVYKLTAEENFCIHSLGNEMLLEIDEDIRKEEEASRTPSDSGVSGARSAKIEGPEVSGIRSMMRRRYTKVKREVYPWNEYEPNLEDPTVLASLNQAIHDSNPASQLRVLPSLEGKNPKLALFSTGDMGPGNLLLAEVSSLQVTTASKPKGTRKYCNRCAAFLVLPPGTDRGIKRRDGLLPVNHHQGSLTNIIRSRGSFTPQRAEHEAALTPPGTPPVPPPHKELPPDRQFCPHCNQVVFCSSHCRVEAKDDYHPTLCRYSKVEDGIREAIQKHDALTNHEVSAEAEQIYELLLVRIFALAKTKRKHPLDLDEVRWLNGDLSAASENSDGESLDSAGHSTDSGFSTFSPARGAAASRTLPWSFEANVVRPIKWLTKMALQPVQNVKTCDAWIINTLLAKIMASTRITRGSRHAKVYDVSGRLVTSLGTAARQGLRDDSEICVGSIHPIFSHIQCVSNPQDANIVVEDEGDVCCFARGGEDKMDKPSDAGDKGLPKDKEMSDQGVPDSQEKEDTPAIKAGTMILRHAVEFEANSASVFRR
ncbi:hypothetical protein MMC16_006775 [Acarospora aff. strigata]|nr:hypothetical protein [Acarospora aff. strigata]